MNYCDLDLQNYADAYWGANLSRLSAVKKAYDGTNLFHHLQSVPGSCVIAVRCGEGVAASTFGFLVQAGAKRRAGNVIGPVYGHLFDQGCHHIATIECGW